jgi:hypothetical protein
MKQHQLGQHYSKETKLLEKHKITLLNNLNKTIIDPFVGEGHLLDYYLNLLPINEQIKKFENKEIYGFDIDKKNITFLINKYHTKYNLEIKLLEKLFKNNNSLTLDPNINIIKKNIDDIFIITNPPYLGKNICKKKYPQDFEIYFNKENKIYNDYYEIALNIYSKYSGIWIVPSNLISSSIAKKIRKKIILNCEDIFIYEMKMFEDTDISVCSFFLNNNNKSLEKKILFISDDSNVMEKNIILNKELDIIKEWNDILKTTKQLNIQQGFIDTKIEKGSNKIIVIDTNYKEKEILISDKELNKLNNNILILRTTDTGSEIGRIGLYTIEEIWKNKEAKGLITKISSRIYTQLFFENLTIEEQINLKNNFNQTINQLRNKYNSIFLTNFKNSSNGKQRKRIGFGETFSLINYLIKKH